MEIYESKSNWKIILGTIGAIILIVTLVYSNYLASSLKESEENNLKIYVKALNELMTNEDFNKKVGLEDEIINSFTIPVIFEDEVGHLEGQNFSEGQDTNQIFLTKMKEDFLLKGLTPLEGIGYLNRLYYFPSKLTAYITYFPIVQILLVSIFVFLGYYLFNEARRGEQNRVWAGMAKETAHQLGTPISAIIAWIEHLKLGNDNAEQLEIIEELENDVDRLELIADRFSKIGSAPDKTATDIHDELTRCMQYMQRRAPQLVKFDLQERSGNHPKVAINQHLFDWVIENLYRNALDSMGKEGNITTEINELEDVVEINITDTGKGIPSNKFKTVFQPGYSTKQRGWGLGLSLAKRIIENYHAGKIFVKKSKPDEGTTFTIQLPKT